MVLEAQGYLDDPGGQPTTILEGWSVEQAVASGASAAKLLLPYHPDRAPAVEQERVAADVIAVCARVELPLALEPLFYDLARPGDRARVVVETALSGGGLFADFLEDLASRARTDAPGSWSVPRFEQLLAIVDQIS